MQDTTTTGRTRGDRTRAALISAARTRFAALGFEGALGAEIASDAGVTEPSIGFHFGSKRGLFLAVMEAYYADARAEFDDVVDLSMEPAPRLAAFTRWWVEHLAAHRDLIAEFEHQARPGRGGAEVTETYRRLHESFMRYWLQNLEQLQAVGFLRNDADSRVMLQVFVGATRQVVGDDFSDGAVHDDERLRHMIELMLHGARPPTRPVEDDGAVSLEQLSTKLDRVLDALDAATADATSDR